MSVSMMNASVVVLSDGNNPKLISHDFLARNGIVPDDWRIHDVLVSPPFSNIVYDNGVQFVVELNRLQVRINRPDLVDPVTDLPRMVTEYLRVLPHVPYRGVGINFACIAKGHDLDMVKSLLKIGPWLEVEGGIRGAAIELIYRGGSPRFSVRIEHVSEDASVRGKSVSGIVFSANFDHDFDPEADKARLEFISGTKLWEERFMEYVGGFPLDRD